uniref:Uncharacterized protein n=1 Tax=Rhizophora mucronata TaxID=61149 RepID=A0A2P2IJL1_RHIMU
MSPVIEFFRLPRNFKRCSKKRMCEVERETFCHC